MTEKVERGLLRIEVLHVKKDEKKKDKSNGNCILNLKTEGQSYVERVDLKEEDKCRAARMFVVSPQAIFQIEALDQEQQNGFARFPLRKLIEMGRVKHLVEVMLAQRRDGKLINPLHNLFVVELSLMYFPSTKGSLLITGLEITTARKSQWLERAQPLVFIELRDISNKLKYTAKNGSSLRWEEDVELKVDATLTQNLRVKMIDSGFASQILLQSELNLLKSGLLQPRGEIGSYTFDGMNFNQFVGTLTLNFQFRVD